ncbi:MAG: hypothetical protein WBE51_14600 [Xanthobacteraceae bacterium]
MAPPDETDYVPASYLAGIRRYGPDLISTLFLFFSVSLMAGRVWRFPFDDEIYTLRLIERESALSLLTSFPRYGGDEHPPLGYLVFYGLHQLGLSDAEIRLCSLAMTAAALVLFQLLVLTWIAQRNGKHDTLPTRVFAVLLFSLTPLAVDQGDALRWYPPFALAVALFATLYLAPRSGLTQLWSGAALGLAASIDLTAALLVPPFMLYRYVLQRRFHWRFDLTYWLLAAGGAGLGLYSGFWLFTNHFAHVRGDFGEGIARSILTDTLGFFGGNALGVGQAWIVVPAALVFVLAAACEIERTEPAKPAHFLLLMFSAPALMALFGFGLPRSFLWLAPAVAVLLTMFFDRQIQQGYYGRVLVLVSLVLAAPYSAIANVNFGTHPFKRNSVIPYQSILDFIHSNANGSALIISTDPVVPWMLRTNTADECAGYFMEARACLAGGRRYDSIFVISGHSNRSGHAVTMANFQSLVAEATAGRTKVTSFGAGLDEDAALKSRLSGVPLDRYVLTVDYYR